MTDIIERLVRRLEANPEAMRIGERIDWTGFASAREAEATRTKLEALCAAGALKVTCGKGGFKSTIERVAVLDAAALYAALGLRPRKEVAKDAAAILREGAEPWETSIIDRIEHQWAVHKPWQGFKLDDAGHLLPLQKLARALRDGLHQGTDMRTFSTRCGGDSKLLERNEATLLAYLYHDHDRPEGTLREILAKGGSMKISMPILVSGSFSLRDQPLGVLMDYCGIPVHQLNDFALAGVPQYVLTIENLVSFHRHAVEVNPNREGLVLYTGGHASKAFRDFYVKLVTDVDDHVPFFHWSDVDEGGLEITKTILALNPKVRPHLMTVDLVKQHGSRHSAPITDDGRFDGTWMEPLARYLAIPGTKTLEQEMIDPEVPNPSDATT